MARAGGGKLGPLLEIATTEDPGGPRPLYRSAMSGGVAATPIEAGELTVQVHVVARWHFVANP